MTDDELKEKPCRWSDKENCCWLNMPDSKLSCKGKCSEYEYTGYQVGDGKW